MCLFNSKNLESTTSVRKLLSSTFICGIVYMLHNEVLNFQSVDVASSFGVVWFPAQGSSVLLSCG